MALKPLMPSPKYISLITIDACVRVKLSQIWLRHRKRNAREIYTSGQCMTSYYYYTKIDRACIIFCVLSFVSSYICLCLHLLIGTKSKRERLIQLSVKWTRLCNHTELTHICISLCGLILVFFWTRFFCCPSCMWCVSKALFYSKIDIFRRFEEDRLPYQTWSHIKNESNGNKRRELAIHKKYVEMFKRD